MPLTKLQIGFQDIPNAFNDFKQFLVKHIPLNTDYNTVMFQFYFDFENQQLIIKVKEPHIVHLLTLTDSATYFVLYDISKNQFFAPYYIEQRDAYLQCFKYLYDIMKFYHNDPLCFQIIDTLSSKYTTNEPLHFIVNMRWSPYTRHYVKAITKTHLIWHLLSNSELIQLIRGVVNEINSYKQNRKAVRKLSH